MVADKVVRTADRVRAEVMVADEAAVRAEAQAEALALRVAADPVHKGMALLEAMESGQPQRLGTEQQ